MALFPRFGTEPPAKVAKPAKVGLSPPVHDVNFRNCRNFRSPARLEFQQRAEPDDHLAQRVADLTDTYAERIAILMEAGDIGEDEARSIAEAEIGRRFVETFILDEVAAQMDRLSHWAAPGWISKGFVPEVVLSCLQGPRIVALEPGFALIKSRTGSRLRHETGDA